MGGRYLIYVPEIAAHTVLFFYSKGPRSWSVRDYTTAPTTLRYADQISPDFSADEVLGLARRPGGLLKGAKAQNTNDLPYWRGVVTTVNATLALDPANPTELQRPEVAEETTFELLDDDVFRSFPKARKTLDVKRMRTSPNSEDWVTWTVVRLMHRHKPAAWWFRLLETAGSMGGSQPSLGLPTSINPWVSVTTPVEYERSLRRAMTTGTDPNAAIRASHPDSVEGNSEIDLVIGGEGYTIFIEAKLGSDISPFTKHDPARNQIARNIDCVIEHGAGTPLFWMFVKDRNPARQYMQVIDRYRNELSSLRDALPHRDPETLKRLMASSAVLTWSEILESMELSLPEEMAAAEEIRRRIA